MRAGQALPWDPHPTYSPCNGTLWAKEHSRTFLASLGETPSMANGLPSPMAMVGGRRLRWSSLDSFCPASTAEASWLPTSPLAAPATILLCPPDSPAFLRSVPHVHELQGPSPQS